MVFFYPNYLFSYQTGFLPLDLKSPKENWLVHQISKRARVSLTSPVPLLHPHICAIVFVISDYLQHTMTVLQDKSEIFLQIWESLQNISFQQLATHCSPATFREITFSAYFCNTFFAIGCFVRILPTLFHLRQRPWSDCWRLRVSFDLWEWHVR